MTVAFDGYYRREREVKAKETEAAEARGVLSALFSRLEKQFACKTKKKGRKLRKSLWKRQLVLAKRYHKKMKRFEQKFGKHLKGEGDGT